MQIPLLPDDEYERGNVRKFPSGHVLPIQPDAVDALPKGRRGQHHGVLYHGGWLGHDPHHWPHPVLPLASGAASECTLLLEDEQGGDPVPLYVGYDPLPDARLVGIGETMLEEHVAKCREDDLSEGAMWGVGDHLRRDGLRGAFITHDDSSRRRVAAAMEIAGGIFGRHYVGKGLGYEQMVEEQQRLWRSPPWPVCWDVSCDLGNSCHRDPDGWRSYAVWVRSGGGVAPQSDRWWMLFPRHGVAVAIVHGTWISWHGRKLSHCTAVPRVAGGERLLSVFCSMPADLMKVSERRVDCQAVLQQRASGEGERGRALFDTLRMDMHVLYRTFPRIPAHVSGKAAQRKWVKAHARWAPARVTAVTDTHVEVMVEGGSGKRETLSVQEVSNRLVRP